MNRATKCTATKHWNKKKKKSPEKKKKRKEKKEENILKRNGTWKSRQAQSYNKAATATRHVTVPYRTAYYAMACTHRNRDTLQVVEGDGRWLTSHRSDGSLLVGYTILCLLHTGYKVGRSVGRSGTNSISRLFIQWPREREKVWSLLKRIFKEEEEEEEEEGTRSWEIVT